MKTHTCNELPRESGRIADNTKSTNFQLTTFLLQIMTTEVNTEILTTSYIRVRLFLISLRASI